MTNLKSLRAGLDGGTGALQFKANAASSLTQTTLRVRYRLDVTGTATVTGS